MNPECPICSEDLTATTYLMSTPCGHVFHSACVQEWLRRSLTCPQCRCYTQRNYLRPLYLSYTSGNADNIKDLENRISDLQNILQLKEIEINECRLETKKLLTTVQSQSDNFQQFLSQIAKLETEKAELSRKLEAKSTEVEGLLEGLKENEKKINHLEKYGIADKEAHRLQIEKQREFAAANTAEIEKLKRELAVRVSEKEAITREVTALCAELEETKRKKDVKLEKHESEVNLQEARAIIEEPVPSTENPAGQKKGVQKKQTNLKPKGRKPLSAINSNTEGQKGEEKCRYFLRPR